MKSVRIEAVATLPNPGVIAPLYEVDVVCDCGANGLIDEATGEASFRHSIAPVSHERYSNDKVLVCSCGKKYRLHPQRTHIHISNV